MCLAIPARVIRLLSDSRAIVEQNERELEVSVLPVPDVREGDYVLLNLGVAAQKLSEAEAQEILEMWEQVSLSMINELEDSEMR